MKGLDPKGQPFSVTLSQFRPDQYQEFKLFIEQMSGDAEETIIVSQKEDGNNKWLQSALKNRGTSKKTLIILEKGQPKKNKFSERQLSVFAAGIRTMYSTVFWVVVSDFSVLQATAMFTLQGALQYAFTVENKFFDILNFSKKVGMNTL